ncbi:MAG: hypothetical protein ABR886_12175 [Dehalococcoidales bacterium]
MMRKYLVLAAVAVLGATAFTGCGTLSDDRMQDTDEHAALAPPAGDGALLSLGSLPVSGTIELAPLNAAELDQLGLGGGVPVDDPPYSPFDDYGMYWSDGFSLAGGDILQVKIHSSTPVSWFGVDWSSLDIRGLMATTEEDEDGRSFDPQYPTSSAVENGPDGCTLTVSYEVMEDTDCVLVIKNNNPDTARQLSLAVDLKHSVSLERILKIIPAAKSLDGSRRND